MGLDIYLMRAHSEKEVCYWRKANCVRRFFQEALDADDAQLSRGALVKRKHIEELIDRCDKVLKDHSKADELLPTQDGFFFGTIDYDDWYFDCLKYTKSALKKLLKTYKDVNFLYADSW